MDMNISQEQFEKYSSTKKHYKFYDIVTSHCANFFHCGCLKEKFQRIKAEIIQYTNYIECVRVRYKKHQDHSVYIVFQKE